MVRHWVKLGIFSSLLIGCSSKFESPKLSDYVEIELQDYILEYEEKSGINVEIPIYFSNLNDNKVGICFIYGKNKWIEIDSNYFDSYIDNYYAIKQLIWHELGHCIQNKGHDDTRINKGSYIDIESSIMNSWTFGFQDYFIEFENYYELELLQSSSILNKNQNIDHGDCVKDLTEY